MCIKRLFNSKHQILWCQSKYQVFLSARIRGSDVMFPQEGLKLCRRPKLLKKLIHYFGLFCFEYFWNASGRNTVQWKQVVIVNGPTQLATGMSHKKVKRFQSVQQCRCKNPTITAVTILIGGAEQTVSDCNHDIIDQTRQKAKIEAYGCEQEMSREIIQPITKQWVF